MSKYLVLKEQLETIGTGEMTCFGNSMTPILSSGSRLLFQKCDDYEVGDIVFCKIKGRFIDAHLVTKKDKGSKRWMISNNHGHENGWTHTIYGKVVKVLS